MDNINTEVEEVVDELLQFTLSSVNPQNRDIYAQAYIGIENGVVRTKLSELLNRVMNMAESTIPDYTPLAINTIYKEMYRLQLNRNGMIVDSMSDLTILVGLNDLMSELKSSSVLANILREIPATSCTISQLLEMLDFPVSMELVSVIEDDSEFISVLYKENIEAISIEQPIVEDAS